MAITGRTKLGTQPQDAGAPQIPADLDQRIQKLKARGVPDEAISNALANKYGIKYTPTKTETPKQQSGVDMIKGFVSGLAKPFVDTGRKVAATPFEIARFGMLKTGENLGKIGLKEQGNQLSAMAAFDNPVMSEQELGQYNAGNFGNVALDTAKDTAGIASWMPGNILLSGALGGVGYGEGDTVGEIAKDAATGAVTAGGINLLGKFIGKAGQAAKGAGKWALRDAPAGQTMKRLMLSPGSIDDVAAPAKKLLSSKSKFGIEPLPVNAKATARAEHALKVIDKVEKAIDDNLTTVNPYKLLEDAGITGYEQINKGLAKSINKYVSSGGIKKAEAEVLKSVAGKLERRANMSMRELKELMRFAGREANLGAKANKNTDGLRNVLTEWRKTFNTTPGLEEANAYLQMAGGLLKNAPKAELKRLAELYPSQMELGLGFVSPWSLAPMAASRAIRTQPVMTSLYRTGEKVTDAASKIKRVTGKLPKVPKGGSELLRKTFINQAIKEITKGEE